MPPSPARPPNVLLIMTDQQRADALGCAGAGFLRTPVLDALAAGGVRFTRAYCNSPLCTPSRATLLSGLYPSRHGAWHVGTRVPDDVPLLSHRLAAAGYRTHYIGKAHLQPAAGDPAISAESLTPDGRYPAWQGPYYGFAQVELAPGHALYNRRNGHYADWLRAKTGAAGPAYAHQDRASVAFGAQAIDWDLPVTLHNSTWTGERAAAFLAGVGHTQPFFLTVSFQDPHHPHAVPRDLRDRVDPADVPPPIRRAGELADKPAHFLATYRDELAAWNRRGSFAMSGQGGPTPYHAVSAADTREARAYYYDLVHLIDRSLAPVLATLRERQLEENTLVIFTSDHGELLGDHGLWRKGPYHYESLLRVPLIMRWPGRLPAGATSSALVSLVDLAPSVLAACGLPTAGLDGRSLVPFAREAPSARDEVFVELLEDPARMELRTLVTRDWKITTYTGETWGELYDLRHDPNEFINRWSDPGLTELKAGLRQRLATHGLSPARQEPRLAAS